MAPFIHSFISHIPNAGVIPLLLYILQLWKYFAGYVIVVAKQNIFKMLLWNAVEEDGYKFGTFSAIIPATHRPEKEMKSVHSFRYIPPIMPSILSVI